MASRPPDPPTWSRPRQAMALFARGRTVRTATPTAALVGTVLSLVNQGAIIAGGHADGGTWLRVAVNYLVPFCVASVGYLSAHRTPRRPRPAAGPKSTSRP
ncbi:nitrate/nitrite transporter NrtS [Mycobacterium sp. SM1]|uniref:nitrate/nitrite transporter NrtS n=1 Tax=Mycobacterium sp. SM1 TaxID=2816243 RepID=UPI001BD13E60|nr:nitrate/nitrite transporter NrtS [Mycobacterium sp. SM1]MBS4728240.1 nitrate/nitrite transporter NrtS [Mycobacterium sp. SM1]